MSREMYDFIEKSKRKHLTLKDVKRMKVGDKIDVVIWDRNFEEGWIWNEAIKNKPYTPKYFFRRNRHQLTYLGDMKWNIKYPFGETICHNIELDVSELGTNWKWSPIFKEYITLKNDFVNGRIKKLDKPIKKHWSEFPDSTRVGWRGPIMLWEKLEGNTNVHCTS